MAVNLTRRSFLATSALAGSIAAMSLYGCSAGNQKSAGNQNASKAKSSLPSDEIIAALAYSSTNYNPVGNSSALMISAGWHVFEGLYEIDFHDFKTYNALAAGDPVKVDELTYVITLREGAKFSDGTDVTSADVVNAFEKNIANKLYSGLLPFLKRGSVVAKDEKTVTISLEYPFENLLKGRLSLVKIFPAALTDEALATLPVGTGPWKYNSINGAPGGAIEFLPNEHYNGQYKATCKKMTWKVLVNETERTSAITDGSVLAIESVPSNNSAQVAKAGAMVEDIPSFELPFLMFNCKKPPFDNYKVRQALFYAIDVDKLIQNTMDDHASSVTCFLPETYANYKRAKTVYTYDPDKAKQLLQESGQENLSLVLRTNSNWVKSLAAPIIEDWKAVGISVTNQEVADDAMFKDLSIEAAQTGILPFDVLLSPGDPTCFGNDTDLLLSWWYDTPEWINGRTCWGDTPECATLKLLLQQAREASDIKKQQDIWSKCFDIVAEQIPLYPLFHKEVSTAYIGQKLEGFSAISTTGLSFLGTTPLQS